MLPGEDLPFAGRPGLSCSAFRASVQEQVKGL